MNSSFVHQAVRRIRAQEPRTWLPYSLGRFETVRRMYGQTVGAAQFVGAVPGLREAREETLFDGISFDDVTHALDRDSAFLGLRIPKPQLDALTQIVQRSACVAWGTFRRFDARDVDGDGRLPDGARVILAEVEGIDLDPTARTIATDPLLLRALDKHLGYRPVRADVRVLRSFASTATDAERRAAAQTIDFHFDVHSYSFGYANFYLSDVDAESGAHVMVLGSHRSKPLRWLFDSARRTDAEIAAHYPSDRIVTITGPAGTGFLQDSSCYHKVLAPKRANRTMLHVRYY